MNWSSQLVDPVLHVVVVGFHHKKGCQVEYAYPPLIEGNSVESHECPTKWRHLPSLALPDGAHNFPEDTIYFHLPSLDESQMTIFGVSCCCQIDANEVLNKNEDVTRNTVQKSVCVLSRLPVFGLIQVKLEMITHAYFKGRDFSQVELLENTYKTLNSSLTESLLQNSHIHLGLSGRGLLKQFRHKLVVLFKLFLLEKKVLFYSSPVKPICVSILAIMSLFPGLIEQGLFEAARFDETLVTISPTIEIASPFETQKKLKENTSPSDSAAATKTNTSPKDIKHRQDEQHRHLKTDPNSSLLTSSLQYLTQPQQQKWHSVTLSHLKTKFFSTFKNSEHDIQLTQQSYSTSLPSIPTSSDDKTSVEGNSVFYGDILPPKKISNPPKPKVSPLGLKISSDVGSTSIFVAPNSCGSEEMQEPVFLEEPVASCQAPIHSSKLSPSEKTPPQQSLLVTDECRSSTCSEPQKLLSDGSASTSNNPDLPHDGKPLNADAEDMLVDDDDDDDLVWRGHQLRLEIDEFPDDHLETFDCKESGGELKRDGSKLFRSAEGACGSNVDLKSSPESSLFANGLDGFGLPLLIFSKGVLCHPYLSLHLYDMLTDCSITGFVIGATNALFKQRRQLLDVIVELNESKIDIMDAELKKCLTLSTADLRFADMLVRSLNEECGDPFLDDTGWEGGDDWIRSQFKIYLLSLLATVNHGDERAEEDFNSSFIAAWKTTNNYRLWAGNAPYSSLSTLAGEHVCKGNMSMLDIKLKINQVMTNSGKERKISSVVTQTGKAVGAAVNFAKSTVSSWFGGFAPKE